MLVQPLEEFAGIDVKETLKEKLGLFGHGKENREMKEYGLEEKKHPAESMVNFLAKKAGVKENIIGGKKEESVSEIIQKERKIQPRRQDVLKKVIGGAGFVHVSDTLERLFGKKKGEEEEGKSKGILQSILQGGITGLMPSLLSAIPEILAAALPIVVPLLIAGGLFALITGIYQGMAKKDTAEANRIEATITSDPKQVAALQAKGVNVKDLSHYTADQMAQAKKVATGQVSASDVGHSAASFLNQGQGIGYSSGSTMKLLAATGNTYGENQQAADAKESFSPSY